MTQAPVRDHAFDVKKDPLDLRDVLYEPSLRELPFAIRPDFLSYRILDQGTEGACTGFGLAAVANYLLAHRSDRGENEAHVSERMLYEMAKRYDEWEGTHYDGSSIRGAMKGWNKHGVCRQSLWKYEPRNAGQLTKERQNDALQYRLGAYYRVRHTHLNHMHSALNEAGILYASALVHDGWDEVDPKSGHLPLRSGRVGGHAFAIVGYDREGLWIQNSWGPDWGMRGFCHLSYEDWLENGMDCWVARLGVPTAKRAADVRVGGIVSSFDHMPHEADTLNNILHHYVNLGNDGAFSERGRYTSSKTSVNATVSEMKATMKEWGSTPKLMLYAHGGLNSEQAAARDIDKMLPHFEADRIYPVHFIWETGLFETIRHIIEDGLRRGRFLGWEDRLRDRFYDLLDEGIELVARQTAPVFWQQMKQNARGASATAGGARYLADQIAQQFANDGAPEIHLVGHSAGSIFLSHLAPVLKEFGLNVRSMTLLAPACTIDLFREKVLSAGGIERVTIMNLTDEYEQDDDILRTYNKSILYLVSEALEPEKVGMPLLGMNKFIQKDGDLQEQLGEPERGKSTVIYSRGGTDVDLSSKSTRHTHFDDEPETLNSVLRIITGKEELAHPFEQGRGARE